MTCNTASIRLYLKHKRAQLLHGNKVSRKLSQTHTRIHKRLYARHCTLNIFQSASACNYGNSLQHLLATEIFKKLRMQTYFIQRGTYRWTARHVGLMCRNSPTLVTTHEQCIYTYCMCNVRMAHAYVKQFVGYTHTYTSCIQSTCM